MCDMAEVRIVCNGREFIPISWVVTESVWAYSAEVTMTFQSPLPSSIWEWYGTSAQYVVVSAECTSNTEWTYKSYPAAYWSLCSVSSTPYNGVGSLLDVSSALALDVRAAHSRSAYLSHRWVLGSYRGQRLFDALCLGAAVSQGGCSTLRYSVDGYMRHVDLQVLEGHGVSTFNFTGDNGGLTAGLSGMVSTPSVVDFYIDGAGGVGKGEVLRFGSDSTRGVYKTYLSNDEIALSREWVLRNSYGRTLYRSRVIKFKDVDIKGGVLACGVCCTYIGGGGSGQRYICTAYTSANSGGTPSIELDCILL